MKSKAFFRRFTAKSHSRQIPVKGLQRRPTQYPLWGSIPRVFRKRGILRLQSMADGFAWPPRQQVGAGSACQTNFGGGLGERSAGPTATCCRASCRQAIRYSRPSPSHPSRQRRPIIRREFCGFEEPSRSNLWRLGSCAIRRQQVGAGSACPPHNPQRILRIRRTQPLRFMAAGFVCYSAVASGTGHCPALPILPRLSQSRRATNARKKSLFSS